MKNMVRYEICENGVVREVEVSVEDYGRQVKKALSDKRSSGAREKV